MNLPPAVVKDVFEVLKEAKAPITERILYRRTDRIDADGKVKPGASGHRVDIEETVWWLVNKGYMRLPAERALEEAVEAYFEVLDNSTFDEDKLEELEDAMFNALEALKTQRDTLSA